MSVAWGRKRESPGRLAAAALPASLHRMSASVCVCVFICSPTVTFLWVFTLTRALRTHTHTHTHTPPTGITAEKLHLSEKCPHFNLQLRRSPGPSAQRAFGSAEQSKQERRALISVLCNITIMVNKKVNRSPRACSSQASSPLFTLGWRPLWAHPEPMLTPQKYTGITLATCAFTLQSCTMVDK